MKLKEFKEEVDELYELYGGKIDVYRLDYEYFLVKSIYKKSIGKSVNSMVEGIVIE